MGPELTIWIVHLFGLLAGWCLLRALPRCTAGTGAGLDPVSVIIPVRNEEDNLPTLLASLNRQSPPPDEILVVDDGSTDRTAERARAAGATMLTSVPLPSGWRGKAWACQQGADAAAHSILIFMDADTRVEPGGLSAVRETFARCGGALSLAAFQTLGKPYEQLSAFFIAVMTAASELFGPFLMVSKTDYQKVGGHDAVKNRVLENVYLAAEFRKAGIPVRCLGGQGTLSIRMYPGGLRELSNGWKKAFATGAGQTSPLRMAGLIFWLSAAAGTAVMLLLSACTEYSLLLWGSLYAAFAGLLFIQLRRLGQFRFWTALFYPVALVFFFALFAQSSFQKQQIWKGRIYAD